MTEERWELSLSKSFKRYRWAHDDSKVALMTEGQLAIYKSEQSEPVAVLDLSKSNVRGTAWSQDGTLLVVLTDQEIISVDGSTVKETWRIPRPKDVHNSLWFSAAGELCLTDGKAIYYRDSKNGGPLSLKTKKLETRIWSPTPIRGNLLLVTDHQVVDATSGKLKWNFVNGSDRSGTPVLIRWRPSGQLINPHEAAEQVYYLVESKTNPEQLDVLTHSEFIKLLPDELRKSEEAVFQLAP